MQLHIESHTFILKLFWVSFLSLLEKFYFKDVQYRAVNSESDPDLTHRQSNKNIDRH